MSFTYMSKQIVDQSILQKGKSKQWFLFLKMWIFSGFFLVFCNGKLSFLLLDKQKRLIIWPLMGRMDLTVKY